MSRAAPSCPSVAPTQGTHAMWAEADATRAVFSVEGMRCANCSRALERALLSVDGVIQARVILATARASVSWNPSRTSLKPILASVARAGFRALPLAGPAAESERRSERRLALKRIGLAGLGMMQTMMLVYGLYAGGASMSAAIASYLKIAGMLFATPVLLYSGKPFFEGALRSVRRRALGMDVPVALALLLAFGASVFNTLRGTGETYFDSVTMFIFFLLTGRFLELTIRQRSLTASEALTRSLPSDVKRIGADGTAERISVASIRAGDRLSIPRGTVIPVDGTLSARSALIDEALVTGESMPVAKSFGEELLGGSVNAGDVIEISARSGTTDSALAHIVGLLERAQGERPRALQTADRIAARFVLATVLLALGVAVAWWVVEPSRAFPAALAVLVVTCPCALSLAAPAAVAAATARLARRGLMITRADALERLARIDTAILDKTGTLTCGVPAASVVRTAEDLSAARALAIAAELEASSSHPLASAFAAYRDPSLRAAEVREYPGRGIEAVLEGTRWRLGRTEFVTESAFPGVTHSVSEAGGSDVVLGHSAAVRAEFSVRDALRADAAEAVEALQRLHVDVVLASGDLEQEVERASRIIGVTRALGGMTPEGKLALVRREQQGGRKALVVGDGINDGPVLAAAYVSCAMGQGSAIALAAADMLLLNDRLMSLAEGVRTARRMLAVMRQNLFWAFFYNMAAVPAAALGWLPPWMAALGMSLSSLAVVLNSTRVTLSAADSNRISPGRCRPQAHPATGAAL